MAKKQFQKITTAFNASIEPMDGEKCLITMWGLNSKGTECKVTMEAPDYFVKGLHEGIVKVVDKKILRAMEYKNTIQKGTNSLNF